MADIDFKNSVNADTAYVDGHKVKLIAVPDGSLELPISANDEYGYVVDANGKKHRVLLATFLEGDVDYKPSAVDTAYMTINSQKVKVSLAAKLNGTQYLSDSANVNDCYTEDDDGNKHRTILVATPTGSLELPTTATSDSAYVIDNDGNKHKVRLFAVLAGGITEVVVSGVPPLNLLGAVEDSLSSVKAYGGLLQSGVPTPSDPVDLVCNNGALKILDKNDWTIFTNPSSIAGQGVYVSATGKWTTADDRGAGVAIPLTIGKQYTLTIHQKTVALGTTLRFGQSPQATPTAAGVQLTDWYRGTIADGQIVSFVAKLPYLVIQFSAVAVEAGMIQEAIEVLEAQGDNEILAITTKNMCNVATDTDGKYIGEYGTIGTNASSCYSDLIPVVAGQTYTWSGICGNSGSSNNKRVHAYIDGVWSQQVDLTIVPANQPFAITFTVPAGCNGIRISHWNTDTNTQVEVGSTKTDYIAYNDSTAGVANLLKIGNYVDTQEILTGLINHQLGIRVFDGTEDWILSNSSRGQFYLEDTSINYSTVLTCMCSHFVGISNGESLNNYPDEDVIRAGYSGGNPTWAQRFIIQKVGTSQLSTLKSWLAAQYAAGTPVIVVYPLATAQDEVAPVPQTMQTVAGDNTLDMVQSGMGGLEVEAQYKKQQ